MLSIIITALDKPKITATHVRECMNSTVIPDEIIVVNDCGDDSLRDELLKLEKKTKIIYAKVLDDIPWNYNGACNLGAWLSTGDIIGFEDTDNIPQKDFYKGALEILASKPNIGRVIGKHRYDVTSEGLDKPVDEWEVIGGRGPNQGSYLMRRDIYLKLKGQNEEMCGRYGWMYYEWKRRLLNPDKGGTEFSSFGHFYYVTDGQCGLGHKNERENYGLLNKSTREPHPHSELGILNFKYEYEEL